jgi:two-component system sensor histidine kinase KdpD
MKERPDPEKLLRLVQKEGDQKGKLKIFFGAVAGVGKTYAMLEAARQRKKEGVDVVAGLVETHKRSETEALLDGLEILPARKIFYKNIEIREFDIDLALKRRPALILVDELAHTNAPDSRHIKRWQDVEELLAAGVNVYTTLNVQHCESVTDVVTQVTGVIIRETVPDTFIEKADEIELIDLPHDELLKRLKEGKVYLGAQAERAAENFFQPGNLIALRQLALRYAARKVDTQMRLYKEMSSISKVWNIGERFLVCVSPSPSSVRLVRSAKRISSEIGAPWTVAYVETPASLRLAEKDRQRVANTLHFAETLGANAVTLHGQDVSDALISYAKSNDISKIIIGKPVWSRWKEKFTGSIIDKLTKSCGDIDVYIISGEAEEHDTVIRGASKRDKTFPLKAVLISLLSVGLVTLLNYFLFRVGLSIINLIMIYLLAVAWLAYRYGRRVSILCSLLSVLCFDFFFIPPSFTFAVSDVEYLITFGIMLITGLLISELAHRLRQQTKIMYSREERTRVLYDMTKDIARSSNPNEIFNIALYHIENFMKAPAAVFLKDENEFRRIDGKKFILPQVDSKETAVVGWVCQNRKIAGAGTDTLPSSKGFYIPLTGLERLVGVLGIFLTDKGEFIDPDSMHVLEAFCKQTAMAVEGADFALAAVKAESQVENERVRNFLLTTFSYELPGPLAEISQAADELMKTENITDAGKRAGLINKIKNEAKRLSDLATELPKVVEGEKNSET